MEDLFGRFTTAVLKLNQLVRKIKIAEVRELGLKSEHVMIVHFLAEAPGGLTAGQLVNRTLQDKAAVSRGLAFLQRKGFLQYDPSRHNSAVRLTPAGSELAGRIKQRTDEAVAACRMDFSETERAFFYRAMLKLAGKLEDYCDSLSGPKGRTEVPSREEEQSPEPLVPGP